MSPLRFNKILYKRQHKDMYDRSHTLRKIQNIENLKLFIHIQNQLFLYNSNE